MALIDKPAVATFTFEDDSGGSAGYMRFNVPAGTLADAALTAMVALRPLLQAMTDCAIVGYSLTYPVYDTAPPTPVAKSRNERKGQFHFLTANAKKVQYELPGIKTSLLRKDGSIDEDQPAVQTFVNLMKDVDAIFCDSNGVDIVEYIGGREIFRGSTPGQLPRSYRPDADILPG